jgi:hypothetical protein
MRLAFRLGQRQQHIPPPSGDGRPVGQRDYDLRAHETYEQAVVGGGQGGNIVFTFMLTNSFSPPHTQPFRLNRNWLRLLS